MMKDDPLQKMRLLLKRLKNPEMKIPPTIHVAGTNGKGSSIAFMAAILKAAGLRVHIYTSPHLLHCTERISLNGIPIPPKQLEAYRQHIQQLAPSPLSFFEEMTAAAFLAFSDHSADVVLLETGIGGRLDPTNLIPNPAVCVITPLSFDHENYLGSSIDQIACEKAGIIKKNAQVVIAPQDYPIQKILKNKTVEVGATITHHLFHQKNDESLLSLMPNSLNKDSMPHMRGIYQPINAQTAVAALLALQSTLKFPLTKSIVSEGLRTARWHGRMQRVSQSPDVWLEGAHNEGGFLKLREQILLWKQNDNRPIHLAVATLANRNPKTLLTILGNYVDKIYALRMKETTSEHEQFHSAEIFDILCSRELCLKTYCEIVDLENLPKIIQQDGNNPRYIITGSLYLVSKILHNETFLEEINELKK